MRDAYGVIRHVAEVHLKEREEPTAQDLPLEAVNATRLRRAYGSIDNPNG
jgi:hypothetical protein